MPNPWHSLLTGIALCTGGPLAAAAPHDVPLPPPRPAERAVMPAGRPPSEPFGPALPQPLPNPGVPPVNEADTASCDRLLASGTAVATTVPRVTGDPGCGIPAPVKLAGFVLRDGAPVALEPPAVMRCDFAERLVAWVRDDLAPLLPSERGRLVRITDADAYECRGRNRIAGAKLSEHATGNAIDLVSLSFADGSRADITKVATDINLFAQIKLTTCARFTTVLGPGSDGYHEDNLHLDAAQRRGDAHFCRWRLP